MYFNSEELRGLCHLPNVINFEVADKARNSAYFGKINGAVRPKLNWIEK
jgi:hypothetical protein|tara:strand:- start:310 stop:456 length:147 start_codon:yes stop_codon:yes gene_type:complete